MSRFLDPRGRPSYGIALCGRCSKKFFLDELRDDPNIPGLKVCSKDWDLFDPWRLPPPRGEDLALPFVRPDTDISIPISTSVSFTNYILLQNGGRIILADGSLLINKVS